MSVRVFFSFLFDSLLEFLFFFCSVERKGGTKNHNYLLSALPAIAGWSAFPDRKRAIKKKKKKPNPPFLLFLQAF